MDKEKLLADVNWWISTYDLRQRFVCDLLTILIEEIKFVLYHLFFSIRFSCQHVLLFLLKRYFNYKNKIATVQVDVI